MRYRELSPAEILEAVSASEWCHLGAAKNDQPYVIPMYFSYGQDDSGHLFFVLNSSAIGMKEQYLTANDQVCLEFEQRGESGVATVVATGIAQIVEQEDGRAKIIVIAREVTGRLYFGF